MDKKTGKFTTKIRLHLREKFSKEKHQTVVLNNLLEKHYDIHKSNFILGRNSK